MSSFLTRKIKNSKALLGYFFLTYLDKVISFALPLSILFIIRDNQLYTFVEVVFSYATIAMVVIELGFSNYLFYGYKQAGDKEGFTAQSKTLFRFLLFFYCLLAIPLFIGARLFSAALLELFILVFARTVFTLFVSFYANIYRLKDKPSGIYLTTIAVNLASFLLLMAAHLFGLPHQLLWFFFPSLLVVVFVAAKFVVAELGAFKWRAFKGFLSSSLRFSWPIILNVLAMSFMNNYAKIYAYGHLSQEETLQISYIMRVGLIIQLTHTSFSSFFSKTIFMDERKQINLRMLARYSLVMLFSTFLVILIIGGTNFFFSDLVTIPFSLSTCLFVFYILLWCYIGYLEIYFGVMNANRKILYYSILCSAVYTVLLLLSGTVHLLQLSAYMVLTAVLNLVLVMSGLRKLGMLGFKPERISE